LKIEELNRYAENVQRPTPMNCEQALNPSTHSYGAAGAQPPNAEFFIER